MKRYKKVSCIVALLLSLSFVFTGCSTGVQQAGEQKQVEAIRWRMVTHQMPGTSRYTDTIIPFVEAVKEASGGRLIIEPYGAGVLFPVTETLESVKSGVVEMSASWDGLWAGKDPVFALAGSIPTDPIRTFSEHFYRSNRLEPIIAKAYEKYGVTYLGPLDFGPLEILMSKKPIKSIDDFKGLNIRTAGIGGDFYTKLGGSVISTASNELYTALQLGTVDAAEYNDWIVNMEMGFHEITDYVIEPVLHVGATSDKSIVVNSNAWNKLPDDLKAIVKTCMNVARMKSATEFEVGGIQAKKDFLAAGAQIIELSDADVKKARELASEVVKEYAAKNEATQEFVDEYIKILVDLGYVDFAKNLGYKGD